MQVRVIDHGFGGLAHVIASYLVPTAVGPVLIEAGPASSYATLAAGISALGYAPEEVRHVFVTHIHLDHAGGAWQFAERGATIYVHPRGAPHLADPTKLLASAARIYGDQMESLWGEVRPIAAERLRVLSDGEEVRLGQTTVRAVATPGHAAHHHVYAINGLLFAGDIAGIRIGQGPVLPPTPPPDIDLEAWRASLQRVRELAPDALYLTHFGRTDDVREHVDRLEAKLEAWASWTLNALRAGRDDQELIEEFVRYWREDLRACGLDEERIREYELADPPWMNLQGLVRYWRKHHPEALGPGR